mmetsp:Transcript_23389/g.79009  ORF Transcript_23389/g.79009 Transcript_23389/m.79009 type:complete len:294 (-) Transcript_23389:27-908(-)
MHRRNEADGAGAARVGPAAAAVRGLGAGHVAARPEARLPEPGQALAFALAAEAVDLVRVQVAGPVGVRFAGARQRGHAVLAPVQDVVAADARRKVVGEEGERIGKDLRRAAAVVAHDDVDRRVGHLHQQIARRVGLQRKQPRVRPLVYVAEENQRQRLAVHDEARARRVEVWEVDDGHDGRRGGWVHLQVRRYCVVSVFECRFGARKVDDGLDDRVLARRRPRWIVVDDVVRSVPEGRHLVELVRERGAAGADVFGAGEARDGAVDADRRARLKDLGARARGQQSEGEPRRRG